MRVIPIRKIHYKLGLFSFLVFSLSFLFKEKCGELKKKRGKNSFTLPFMFIMLCYHSSLSGFSSCTFIPFNLTARGISQSGIQTHFRSRDLQPALLFQYGYRHLPRELTEHTALQCLLRANIFRPFLVKLLHNRSFLLFLFFRQKQDLSSLCLLSFPLT